MTELSFLIELLLKHELSACTRDLVADRIRDVEGLIIGRSLQYPQAPSTRSALGSQYVASTVQKQGLEQCASTLALMAKHGDIPNIPAPEMPPVEPVTQIAQTPATAAAMDARNDSINAALSGKVDKVSGRPRKW